jgi:hypothetical protein
MSERMSLRQERIAKGLCPKCGAEAAPYYLCQRCHLRGQIYRFCASTQKQGLIEISVDPDDKRKRRVRAAHPHIDVDQISYSGLGLGERAAPRLKRIPVDVERELVALLERAGKPLHVDEIIEAWGRLRVQSQRRQRISVAIDLTYIIESRRRQTDKLARRAARARHA